MFSSIYILMPLTDSARTWVQKNIQYESYQQRGAGVVVEHRYISAIVDGLSGEGFVPGSDFAVMEG